MFLYTIHHTASKYNTQVSERNCGCVCQHVILSKWMFYCCCCCLSIIIFARSQSGFCSIFSQCIIMYSLWYSRFLLFAFMPCGNGIKRSFISSIEYLSYLTNSSLMLVHSFTLSIWLMVLSHIHFHEVALSFCTRVCVLASVFS